MTEQQQKEKVRQRRSRAEAAQLAAEYEASNLSRAEYCRSRGLALSTLNRYLKRRRQAAMAGGGGTQWVSVEISGDGPTGAMVGSSGLALVLAHGRRIELARRFDADSLEQLLGVLERH